MTVVEVPLSCYKVILGYIEEMRHFVNPGTTFEALSIAFNEVCSSSCTERLETFCACAVAINIVPARTNYVVNSRLYVPPHL